MRKFPEAPRVVHISPAAFGDEGIFGGGERYPFELARAMAAHTPVRLVTFGNSPRTWQDGPLSIRVLPLRGQWKGSEVNPLSEQLLGELLRADVIHLHQWESVVANVGVIAGHLTRRRVFATDLGGSGKNYWRRLRLQRWVDGFLAISQFSADFYPEMDNQNTVVLGGVDPDKFHPGPPESRRRRALFVGRLLPHKGIDRLIEAIPADLELLVIGRPYDADYRLLLESRAKGKSVEFRERVEDEELREAYRTSRALVLPSVYRTTFGADARKSELLGLTLLEGMASGTPAVCTAVGGMPEIVDDGKTGFIVDPEDLVGLGAAVERLVNLDDEAWDAMSHNARAVSTNRSWDAMARICLATYRDAT